MGGNYEKSIYNQLMDVMEHLETVEKEHKKETSSLKRRIDELEKENQALKEENHLLRGEVSRLKSILNNDSSNTSNPPSTDQKGGKPANTYNGRHKSGKKKGGQKGHKGATLTKAHVEEMIRSRKCRHEIKEVGDPSTGKYVTRYTVDLKVVPHVTEVRIYADGNGKFAIPEEYRGGVTYGPCVKSLAVALYSEGVMANDRIATFLNAAGEGSLGLSAGSIYHFCSDFSRKAGESIRHLEAAQLNEGVVATDATTVTLDGRLCYIRNFSTEKTVLYKAMEKKTIAAMKQVPFLKKYAGTLVHDHETGLYHFGTGHGECNVHALRYLKKNSEETKNSWSGKMSALLSEMNQRRKEAAAAGEVAFPAAVLSAYEKRYDEILAEGYGENKTTKHQYAKDDEKRLLNRLAKYKGNHLLFLHDFRVPFDDNMSERDLRKAKNRQKMSGGFRKSSGHEMYCNILTVIETLKRRDMGIIENIRRLFMGIPAIF